MALITASFDKADVSSISAFVGAIDRTFPPIDLTALVTVIWQWGLFMFGIVRFIVSIRICFFYLN